MSNNNIEAQKMFSDYCTTYGKKEAVEICNRYLDMQINTKNSDELDFCKCLYRIMQEK